MVFSVFSSFQFLIGSMKEDMISYLDDEDNSFNSL